MALRFLLLCDRCLVASARRKTALALCPALPERRVHNGPSLLFPHATVVRSSPSRLVQRLERRFGEGKDGLGFEPDSSALASARSGLMRSINSATGHEETHLTPETEAANVCSHYSVLDSKDKKAFFAVLAGDFGIDHGKLASRAHKLAEMYSQHKSEAAMLNLEGHLRKAMKPPYTDLFRHISRLEGGMKFLVDLRGDLLDAIRSRDSNSMYQLVEMDSHLREFLSQWFSVGTLRLRQVTWESPCDILEKISQYEAVHPLRHWRDLKHRVGGANRRCFIFTHRAIAREPLVVLHAALTTSPSSSIQALLNRNQTEDLKQANTAVFYSVFATQRGLSGIELGNFMIHKVVQALNREFPGQLSRFLTLSPVPGFRKWLDSHLKLHAPNPEGCHIKRDELNSLMKLLPNHHDNHVQALQAALGDSSWVVESDGPVARALQLPLTRLCTRYLAVETRRGKALDPVCHFHSANGASLWRLNWLADTSPAGLQRSYGFMANYDYDLPAMARHSASYQMTGSVGVSDSLKEYL